MLKKGLILMLALSSLPAFAVSQTEIDDIKSRLEELEYKGYENYVKFGGMLENKYINYELEDKKATTDAARYTRLQRFATRANLDVAATPRKDTAVYMRLTMSKFWNRFNTTSVNNSDDGTLSTTNSFGDMRTGTQPGHATFYLTRAFLQYEPLEDMKLSIGRLPTVDGHPKEYETGSKEGSAYHTFVLSATLDGLALSKRFRFKDHSVLAAKAIFSPYQYHDENVATIVDLKNSGELYDSAGASVDGMDNLYTAIIDYETRSIPLVERAKILYTFAQYNDVYMGTATTASSGVGSSSNLRVDVTKHVASLDLRGILNSGLDLSFSYAGVKSESKGGVGYPAASPVTYLALFCNNSSKSGTCKASGDALALSTRYRFSEKFALGYLMTKISSGAFMFDTVKLGHQMFSYAGSKNHRIYSYYKLNSYLTLTAAYTRADIDSQSAVPPLVGSRSVKDWKITGFDMGITATF